MIKLSTLPKPPRRYAHFLFAIIQSGMTSAIAFFRVAMDASLISDWVTSWLAAWATMVPIVLSAVIRSICQCLDQRREMRAAVEDTRDSVQLK